MSKLTLLLASAILAVSLTIAQAGVLHHRVARQTIPREFQNINIENYLKNPRAVQFQLKCVIYDGPCDRIGKYLKVSIPELLTNQCRNCQPEQRKQTGRLVAFLQQNYPKEWEDAIKKFQGGRQFTGDEIKKFEQDFGVQAVAVSTIAPATGELANVTITTEKISAAEVGSIVKDFGNQYLEAAKKAGNPVNTATLPSVAQVSDLFTTKATPTVAVPAAQVTTPAPASTVAAVA